MIRLVETFIGPISHTAFGACVLTSLQQRHRHLGREGHVELAGDEGEDRRRAVGDDRELDAVEIRPARLPVVGVAVSLIDSFCLNSTNLNGPVPIGLVRMSPGVTWQG